MLSVDLNKYRGLIFDLDGTLLDSMPHHVRAWIQTAREHGFEIDPKLIYAWGGISSQDVVRRFIDMGYPAGDVDLFVKRKVELYREHINEVKLFAPIEKILKDAHDRGQLIAIASGTQRVNGEDTLRLHHLEKYVDALVCADDVTHHKPHPESFLTAASKLGLSNEDCLIFEDGKLGIEAALAGGFDCVEGQEGEMIKFYKSK